MVGARSEEIQVGLMKRLRGRRCAPRPRMEHGHSPEPPYEILQRSEWISSRCNGAPLRTLLGVDRQQRHFVEASPLLGRKSTVKGSSISRLVLCTGQANAKHRLQRLRRPGHAVSTQKKLPWSRRSQHTLQRDHERTRGGQRPHARRGQARTWRSPNSRTD